MTASRTVLAPTLLLLLILTYAIAWGQDDTEYKIAKRYQDNENYLLAYKHLLLFRCANLQYLQRPSNKSQLEQLDNYIEEFEVYLGQRLILSPLVLRKIRGYTDHQLDSAFRDRGKSIKLKDINIK
jgi:hypothetical protein